MLLLRLPATLTHTHTHTTHSKSNETPKHRQGKSGVGKAEWEKREEIECRPCNLQLLPQSIAAAQKPPTQKKRDPPLAEAFISSGWKCGFLSTFFLLLFSMPALPKNLQPDAVGQLNPFSPHSHTHTHTHAGKVQKKM